MITSGNFLLSFKNLLSPLKWFFSIMLEKWQNLVSKPEANSL